MQTMFNVVWSLKWMHGKHNKLMFMSSEHTFLIAQNVDIITTNVILQSWSTNCAEQCIYVKYSSIVAAFK